MQRHSDKPLPAVPKPATRLISIPEFELADFEPLMTGADSLAQSREPLTFEQMDMGWGTMNYSTELPEIPVRSVLTIDEAHDYAQVFVDREYIGTIDRVQRQRSLTLPPVKKGQTLAILVEGMGRINFGRAINDPKGITGPVALRPRLAATRCSGPCATGSASAYPTPTPTPCAPLTTAYTRTSR